MQTRFTRVLVYVGLDRLGDDGLLKLPFVHAVSAPLPSRTHTLTWFAGKETSVYAGSHWPRLWMADVMDEVIEYGGVGLEPVGIIAVKRPPLKGRRILILVIDTQRIVWTSLSAWRIRHGQFHIACRPVLAVVGEATETAINRPKAMQRQMLDLLEIASGKDIPRLRQTYHLDIPQARGAVMAATTAARRDQATSDLHPGSGGRPKCWPLEQVHCGGPPNCRRSTRRESRYS